jgi:hypothetical protein
MPFSKAMMFGETLIADEGGSVQSQRPIRGNPSAIQPFRKML